MELIPRTARRVLDVGCGAGLLGAALKRRQSVEVIGVERHADAARRAREVLDAVHEIDLSDDAVEYPAGPFDAIVCADVLEHLHQPRPVLERLRELLGPEGVLVASLPNVQHHSVVRSLLAGNFTYEPAGLLDEDHKRFFTRREMEKLFYRAGFSVESIRFRPDAEYQRWQAEGQPRTLRLGTLHIEGETAADIEPFYVYQYLLTAKPVGFFFMGPHIHHSGHAQPAGLYPPVPGKPAVLDGRTLRIDCDRQRLHRWHTASAAGPTRHPVDRKAENRGFPAAVNQGLDIAKGEQILLLNNDTLLTTGWLRRLLEALHREPDIGLVGPCSNHVSGPQQIPAGYDDLAELDGFAWERGSRYAGQMIETDRLVGFCLLIRREVVDRIGGNWTSNSGSAAMKMMTTAAGRFRRAIDA